MCGPPKALTRRGGGALVVGRRRRRRDGESVGVDVDGERGGGDEVGRVEVGEVEAVRGHVTVDKGDDLVGGHGALAPQAQLALGLLAPGVDDRHVRDAENDHGVECVVEGGEVGREVAVDVGEVAGRGGASRPEAEAPALEDDHVDRTGDVEPLVRGLAVAPALVGALVVARNAHGPAREERLDRRSHQLAVVSARVAPAVEERIRGVSLGERLELGVRAVKVVDRHHHAALPVRLEQLAERLAHGRLPAALRALQSDQRRRLRAPRHLPSNPLVHGQVQPVQTAARRGRLPRQPE
mmetsp:Transcript_7617/g.23202  ORF Transcript_7617/g.23202 Transcript_7617/m.23202 type:complete len:296 (+) Transcript_7617:63-950(+)